MSKFETNDLYFVADSPIHGRGLFASRNIAADRWIGHYDGPQTTENGMHVLWVDAGNNENGDDKDSWIGYDGNNELRFLNHANDPNGEMDGLALYACRDIRTGEEITIHYGEEFETTAG